MLIETCVLPTGNKKTLKNRGTLKYSATLCSRKFVAMYGAWPYYCVRGNSTYFNGCLKREAPYRIHRYLKDLKLKTINVDSFPAVIMATLLKRDLKLPQPFSYVFQVPTHETHQFRKKRLLVFLRQFVLKYVLYTNGKKKWSILRVNVF